MKISTQLIKKLGYGDIVSLPTDDLVSRIGVQLGAVEEVVELGPRYDGIVVARIVSCTKHPDADRLNICMIDDGRLTQNVERDENDNVQVVCGAPNAREGLIVAWIPPGVVVPSTIENGPFVLEARAIRGQMSNGMLASPKELDLSDDHEGILEIDPNEVGLELTTPGTSFKALYGLDDVIIDIENKMFTHRPDCFGILGVVREIAGIQQKAFKSPDWYMSSDTGSSLEGPALKLTVDNQVPDQVKRFILIAMNNVKVGSSPVWLRSILTRLGIKSVNNVVDITNYLMVLTGQPLHVYDYDKLAALSTDGNVRLQVRLSHKDEKITLLNSKELTFQDDKTAVIAVGDTSVGVGGVMGGSATEVDSDTTRIVIECANFNMYNIRKTSMKYGLFTDAVTRFNKGQSPYQNDRIIMQATKMVSELTGGKITSEIIDDRSYLPSQHKVEVGSDFVNKRLGLSLLAENMAELLRNVECNVQVEADRLIIDPPFWRTDIEIAEDIVEEVGRLYGYDKIPLALPERDIVPAPINQLLAFKQKIRSILSCAGTNELLTYTFVRGQLLEKVGQQTENAFRLSNALSPDLQYYRMSLLPSLLDKVHLNIKSGYGQFTLFELGKVHCKNYLDDDGLPIEDERLAWVFAADEKNARSNHEGAPYYQARRYIQYLTLELGFTVRFESAKDYHPQTPISQAAFAPFEPVRSALIKDKDGVVVGMVGEMRADVCKKLKLPYFIAGFELDVLQLLKLTKKTTYQPLSRYPHIEQDISLQVSTEISYQQVFDTVWDVVIAASKDHGYESKILPLDIYENKSKSEKNITLRVTLNHSNRTLVTEEVNKLMDIISASAKEKLGAKRN